LSELESLAAACLLPGFQGLTPPDWLRAWAEDGLGGVVLFSRNVESREQLAALTGALPGLLAAIDEEGGDVTRLEHSTGSSYPGSFALGVVDDVELTEQVGAAIGSDLAAVGVGLDFAPVADVNTNPRNPVIGIRSFGSDPELVARHVAAFVTGMQAAGVAACAKHFPGHGDTEVDSHLDLPVVAGDLGAALVPFSAAIDAGVRSIMTAHIRVSALDEAPATLSRAILHGLLREELGFTGLVITDALDMNAVSATVGMEEGAVLSLAAGADALCLGAGLDDAPVASIHAAIVDAVRDGRLPEERLREAAGRVRDVAAPAGGDCHVTVTVGLEAARRALHAEGAVQLSRPPFVVELVPEPSIAAGPARHGLGDVLRAETIRLTGPPADDAVQIPDGRQLVLVLRDAHRHAWERELAERLGEDRDAVVVETGIPVWRPSRSAGFVATHGSGRVNFEAAAERLRAG